MRIPVNLLVEGVLDDAVARRLIKEAGGAPAVSFGKRGFGYIRKKIAGFNASTEQVPLLTLVDFADTGTECPPAAVREWLPAPKEKMVFRLVVREIESWLLADRAGFARFLGVPVSRVPFEPESLTDPKNRVVSLARRSRRRALREALVPAVGTSVATGPLYNSELARFAVNLWDPYAAAEVSDSLRKCMERLKEVVAEGRFGI